MAGETMRGRLLWYELMTRDLAAAEIFYTAVVGWTTKPFESEGPPYTLWLRNAGQPIGGAMTLPDELQERGVPPHWMLYVGADRLEDTAAAVEQRGGGPLSPVIDVPDIGRMQTMKDPQGAAFSLYQPASLPAEAEAAPEMGDVSWHELYTTDAEAAMTFYRELFEWQPTETLDMGEMGKYHMFGRSPGPLGGMMTKTAEMSEMPTAWLLYFRVPDVHAAAERVKAQGGTVLNGPMEVPGGDWIVQCTDPQGAAFALHHTKQG
jgi:predicted enzyme related to lactoylglutathione lyase